MALESATYISQLVDTNPAGSDVISQGDDHLRLIKKVLQDSLPDVDQAAATIVPKATAPTTQVLGTIWYDTANALLKINTAATGATPVWVTVNAGAPWASTSKAASCAFRATMSTHQDVANVTLATVVYDTDNSAPTSYDVGADFDTSTYKFTVPETGYYYIEAASRWAGSGGSGAHSVDDDLHIVRTPSGGGASNVITKSALEKDGQSSPAYIQAYPMYSVSGVLSLTALDTIHVTVYTEAGGFRITGGTVSSYFGGFQVA